MMAYSGRFFYGAGFSQLFLASPPAAYSSRYLGALEGQFIIDLYSSHLARGRRTGYKVLKACRSFLLCHCLPVDTRRRARAPVPA